MRNFTFAVLTLLTLPALAQPAPRHPAGPAPLSAARLTSGNPGYRVTQYTKQQFRTSGSSPAAWLDTLRYSFSRFTATGQPQLTVRENAPTRGAALRNSRQDRMRYNPAGQLTVDSTFVYNASTGLPNTYPTLVEVYSYDAQGRLLTDVQSVRIGSNLTPYGRTSYTYNAAGQNTTILDESYYGGVWYGDSRDLLSYNAAGQVATDEFQVADASGTSFGPAFQDLYTYDAAGNVLTDQQQSYGTSAGAYVNTYLLSYTYTGPLGQRSGYQIQRNVGAALLPYGQGNNTFDASGNLTVETQQLWNAGLQAYVNDVRYLYSYQQVLATAAPQLLAERPTLAPNPTAGPVVLHYQLQAAAPVAVQVFDGLGRVVRAVAGQPQVAGTHTLPCPTAGLAAGCYTVRLQAGSQSAALLLTVQ